MNFLSNVVSSVVSFFYPSHDESFALTVGRFAVKLYITPKHTNISPLINEVIRQLIFYKYPTADSPLLCATAQLLRHVVITENYF